MTDTRRANDFICRATCGCVDSEELAAEFAAVRRETEDAQRACDVKVLQAADAWAEERTFASVAALVAAVKARKEARTT